jgi:hypothetical protein
MGVVGAENPANICDVSKFEQQLHDVFSFHHFLVTGIHSRRRFIIDIA